MEISGEIVSTVDIMNRLSVTTIGVCISSLQGTSCRCLQIESASGRGTAADEDILQQVTLTLKNVRSIGFDPASGGRPWPVDCRKVAPSAERAIANDPDVTTIRAHLKVVAEAILRDIGNYAFLWVDNERRFFVDAIALFGSEVQAAFPRADEDIREAGNCLAVECNTAAVFHLMRVSEHGLRAVARRLKVKLTHKGVRQPIEYADWNKVITQIKNEIANLRKLSSGPKQDRRLNFYSDVAEQAEYIKDIWRNRISHTRRSYNGAEALAIKGRVQDFMIRIARGPTHA